ncbi:MAG: hypothetical protein ABEI52_02385 [Halobacteriaceae archaeon]
MEFRSIVIAGFILVIATVGAFTAFQVADTAQKSAPATERNVTNETIPQTYQVWQLVDNATKEYTAGFDENVTVYNSTGVKLSEPEDYEWNSTDGTIYFKDTARTNESRSANVSYTYSWNTQAVREVSGPLGVTTSAFELIAYFAGGMSLIVLLIAVGGFIVKRIGNNNLRRTNR